MHKPAVEKMGAFTGKKAIALIFLVMGVLLMLFIISQGMSLFHTSREDSSKKVSSSLCVGFIYSISGITATDQELQFNFMNEMSSTEVVHNITIIDEAQKSQTFQVSIPIGTSTGLRVPVKVADKFTVYPDGCGIFPATCSVKEGCKYY